MKIRHGFVSNSSSSSFIVAIPKNVNSIWQLKELLFGDREYYCDPYADLYKDYPLWNTTDIASIVLKDFLKAGSCSEDALIETYCQGYTPEYDRAYREICAEYGVKDMWHIEDTEERRNAYRKVDDRLHELARQKIKQFMKENKGNTFYAVTYSDNDGRMFSAMEHGDLFDRVPHLVINMH